MWFSWLQRSVDNSRPDKKVNVICRTKDGHEFDPFSIEWRGDTLILCENEEAG